MIRLLYLLIPFGLTALWVQQDTGPYPWIGQALLRGLGIYIPFLTVLLTLLLTLLMVAVPVLTLRSLGWIPAPSPDGPIDVDSSGRALAILAVLLVTLPAAGAALWNLRAWQQLTPAVPLDLHDSDALPLGAVVQVHGLGRFDASLSADTLGSRSLSRRYLIPLRSPKAPASAPTPLIVLHTRTVPESAYRARWFEARTLQGQLRPAPRAIRLAFAARGVELADGAGLLRAGNPSLQRLGAAVGWLLLSLVSGVGAIRSLLPLRGT